MRVDEITNQPILEMAFNRKTILRKTEQFETQINKHLLKLFGMDADDGLKHHWKAELDAWYDEIGSMVCKTNNKPLGADFYYKVLYDGMFGQVEERNVGRFLDLLVRQGFTRNNEPVDQIVERLRTFHRLASENISNQLSNVQLISEL